MKQHRIAVIAGDGIGQEVIPAGKQVLEAAIGADAELIWHDFPWGNRVLPPDRGADAA